MSYRGYSAAQNKATQKYTKEKYDRIYISIPKGKKDIYKEAAEAAGKSLTQFIIDCIEKEVGRA